MAKRRATKRHIIAAHDAAQNVAWHTSQFWGHAGLFRKSDGSFTDEQAGVLAVRLKHLDEACIKLREASTEGVLLALLKVNPYAAVVGDLVEACFLSVALRWGEETRSIFVGLIGEQGVESQTIHQARIAIDNYAGRLGVISWSLLAMQLYKEAVRATGDHSLTPPSEKNFRDSDVARAVELLEQGVEYNEVSSQTKKSINHVRNLASRLGLAKSQGKTKT